MSKNKIHFEISERKMILHLFDVFFVLLALYFVGTTFEVNYLKEVVLTRTYIVLFVSYLTVFGLVFELYHLQVASNELQVLKSTLLTVSFTILVYLLTPIFSPELPPNRIQIVVFYAVVFISLMSWRFFYVRYLASNRFIQSALLICDDKQVEELVLGLENIDPHYKIIAYVPTDTESINKSLNTTYIDRIEQLEMASFVNENAVSEIVIASQSSEVITPELYQQLMRLLESGKIIRDYSQVYESKTQRIPVQYIARDFYRFFPFSRSNQNKLYLSVVRIFEIILSLLGLFFGLILLPFIIVGNVIANRGGLFYTQKRIGKDGVPFEILKLRTMIKNAELNGAVFATTNDQRITSFGKFLRKTRIDEIPQVINILKGDMAIIGPRPERPEIVKQIAGNMPFYETRHIVKPGLTGWAQVNYSYGENIEDSLIKLQYDLYYIKHRSFYLDLNITLKTITTVLFYRGQ
ncbi:exopolysaccharide biosynthesis polyprenyl glycosylphosphotransferase [Flavobacterium sp. NG2]|uniref:exopolysaccharide biosynthesis polyprenyl glycosylphosphotransferase n=1 Tax=Flavobacterium sp. NG2 TaxID=3097547 RepID=UPI002A7F8D5F|nr:exopolysaccharide biosynthesis polyprenyl glycosylphosphotransferase [Flavobacterium sp. NG2]WPR71589.1 exopolysaccharide biosynthesis polyprenyl glycosylphosphotransferase [Flavobacterium sp. NG2]